MMRGARFLPWVPVTNENTHTAHTQVEGKWKGTKMEEERRCLANVLFENAGMDSTPDDVATLEGICICVCLCGAYAHL